MVREIPRIPISEYWILTRTMKGEKWYWCTPGLRSRLAWKKDRFLALIHRDRKDAVRHLILLRKRNYVGVKLTRVKVFAYRAK